MPATMSPESSAAYIQVYWSMYDPPLTMDEKFNIQPWAAEKWTQVNPTTWRITLRKDLTFSNGDKLTADDLEFTGKLMLDTRMPQIVSFGNLTDVKKVDDYNVDFTTKIADASILPGLTGLWIMPKKYYNDQGKSGFAAKPIGSGPYELSDFRTGDIAVFKKRAAEHPFRKPQPAQITFRSINEATQMVNGLKTGDLDILIGQISPDQINQLSQTDAKIESRLSSVNALLISQPESQQRNTPLTNKQVRLALNYAVDKDAIAKNIYQGQAKPNGQLSVPSSPGWDDSVKPFPYDPAMAKKLLADAGYPNGFKLPIGIEFTPLTGNISMLQAVQSNLRDVGIDAAITQYELAAFLDKFYGRNGGTKGDLFMFGTGDGNGFATGIYGYFTCNKPLAWWCNPEFDKNMEAAVGEPDVAKRGVLLRKASAAIRDDAGLLFLENVPTYVVQGGKMRGFVWTADNLYNFDSAYRVN
jgi:peptide/nickel transport system substrate-binding protein